VIIFCLCLRESPLRLLQGATLIYIKELGLCPSYRPGLPIWVLPLTVNRHWKGTPASSPRRRRSSSWRAVEAVFRSWQSPRAAAYRRMHGLDDRAGTAVTIQRMAFGNAGSSSGARRVAGEAHTGENRLYLDFALNAQGEDVVSGRQALASADQLDRLMPELHAEVVQMAQRLERAFDDAQDFEFTSRRAASICCRPARPSACPGRPCTSPWRWPTRASSPGRRRSSAPTPLTSAIWRAGPRRRVGCAAGEGRAGEPGRG